MGYRTINQFGRAVKREMTRKRMGLRELSRQTGISAGYLSLVLSGERKPPTPELIDKISKVLGITTPKLFWLAKYVPHHDRRYDRLVQKLQFMSDEDIDKLLDQIDRINLQRRNKR